MVDGRWSMDGWIRAVCNRSARYSFFLLGDERKRLVSFRKQSYYSRETMRSFLFSFVAFVSRRRLRRDVSRLGLFEKRAVELRVHLRE